MQGRITPENIYSLKPNEVFGFGSNLKGAHGLGAAKTAVKWGARYGQGIGFAGQTYAIPTKDFKIQVLPLDHIKIYVEYFIAFAKERTDLIFLVTPIGCGYAGYKPEQVAPLFREAVEMENVHLPKVFWDVLLS